MKKIFTTLLMTSAVFAASLNAQDFGEAGDFGDFGDFGGDSEFSDNGGFSSGSKLDVSGKVSTDVRAYVDIEDDEEIEVEAKPAGKLDLNYSGNNSDLLLSLCMDADRIKNNPEDIIDELLLRGRLGDYLTLEAGKMKVVWGKGDKLHVLDNFNADDYSNFIIPDYIDRRISTPMLRAVISLPVANLNVEGIYTPLLPVDRFAMNGRWTPAQFMELTGAVTGLATNKVTLAFKDYTSATATVGGAGAAYNIAVESAAKAKKALDEAVASFNQIEAQYNSVNTKYNGILTGFAQAKAVTPALTWDAYLNLLKASGRINGEEDLENLRKGYAQAAAAYYAATVAKRSAQTSYYGYAEAQKKAEKAYAEAKANAEKAGASYMYALTNAQALSSDPNQIYPDMWTLKYGQFGGRATWTLGQIDMGISYYNGWYKQPSVNGEKLFTYIDKYLANGIVDEDDKFLAYDKKQTFGLEASSIIWHFNVRGEFAYNLTEDVDGNDPWVHNNSIAWLGGFDIDLPFWNANLNVQETGTYILHGDECDKNLADVDYAVNAYTNNKIAVNFTTSFMNDKIAPECTVMYGLENKDLVVMPKITYKADQNLKLAVSGMIINCDDDNSEFKAWEKNSFVSLGAEYTF